MHTFMKFTVLFMISFIFGAVFSLRVLPEKSNVTHINKKYLEWAYSEVKHYGAGRSSTHYVDVAGVSKYTWANNVTFHITFLEYAHGAYRSSYMELHFKFCDMVNADPYIGKLLLKAGLTCPAPAGEYHLTNLTVPSERFPSVWPYAQGRVVIEAALTATGETIATGYLAASFKTDKQTTG